MSNSNGIMSHGSGLHSINVPPPNSGYNDPNNINQHSQHHGERRRMNRASTPLDINSLVKKTPVSILQELFIRKGISPKYELVQIEGQVHEPTFVYRVQVGEHSGVFPFTLIIFNNTYIAQRCVL